jgi:hypothetical protein
MEDIFPNITTLFTHVPRIWANSFDSLGEPIALTPEFCQSHFYP